MNLSLLPMLFVAFPADKNELARIGKAALSALREATGEMPLLVRPDERAVCLLTHGDPARITRHLEAELPSDLRWLLVSVDRSFASSGLSAASDWLAARCS